MITNNAVVLIQKYIKSNDLTQQQFADKVGISRINLNMILNGRTGVSANFAIKVEKASKIPASKLLHAQADYDLEIARAEAKG